MISRMQNLKESDPHIVTQGDNDKLRVLGSLLDIVCNDRDIPEIQSCIYFVHKVERCRLEDMKSEDQGQR